MPTDTALASIVATDGMIKLGRQRRQETGTGTILLCKHLLCCNELENP